MQPAAALLLFLAPLLREPVGQGAWEKSANPVARRVGSLLLGAPHRRGFVSVLPLYARTPSEAGHGAAYPARSAWLDVHAPAKEIADDGHVFLRIRNDATDPLFVPAGAVYAFGGRELFVTRDALVSPEFAALFPARPNLSMARNATRQDMRYAGLLPPEAAGALLFGDDALRMSFGASWSRSFRTPSFVAARAERSVSSLCEALRRECRELPARMERTAVGAVFLIAGRPAAAHVFSSNRLFAEALPDLLMAIAIQARDHQKSFGPGRATALNSRWSAIAATVDERSRALAYLRGALRSEGAWSESYGEGYEVLVRDDAQGAMGHGVLDRRRRVIHFALYSLGRYWPTAGQARGAPPLQPPDPPPGNDPSERSPGEVDRDPRPSVGEKRVRDRRPGPSAGRGR